MYNIYVCFFSSTVVQSTTILCSLGESVIV